MFNDELVSAATHVVRGLQEIAEIDCCGQYRWMTYAVAIFGFFMAFGIGANDVANAFATSVAAKSVSLKQAVVIASICEFLGAMLLGASVTNTIRGKIIDTDLYEEEPDVLMYGMLTSLVSASLILMVANYLALPVSTTHTIVGSIVGFSIAAKGFDSIKWKEVGMIIASWVASPAISGTFAVLFFWLTRKFILLSHEPYKRSIHLYPVIVFLAIGLDAFMVFFKAGANNPQIKEWGLKFSLPVAFGFSFVLAVAWQLIASSYIQQKVEDKVQAKLNPELNPEAETLDKTEKIKVGEDEVNGANDEDGEWNWLDGPKPLKPSSDTATHDKAGASTAVPIVKKSESSIHEFVRKLGDATINRDLEAQAFAQSNKTKEIWEDAEQFDLHTEFMFSYLQVLTACLLSFAHGANDVANAIAPVAAVYSIYAAGAVESKSPVNKWIIFLGAIGIVVGLLMYGYKLMISLGYNITHMSPSRGFCIELSASTVVVVASYIGIPISTTQCQVGGTIGVGLLGGAKNLNPWYCLKVVLGWAATFFAVLIINAGVFSFAFYAPSAKGFE